MKKILKEVVLPCALLVGAVLSLWKFVDWSSPPREELTEEERRTIRCEEEFGTYTPPYVSDDCYEWQRDRVDPPADDERCAAKGGSVWSRDLCSRTVAGLREYLDPNVGYWHDCLTRFESDASKVGDGLDSHCGYPGLPDCLVEAPHWCPENLGYRDAQGKLHLE
jgi:hypothetical protein